MLLGKKASVKFRQKILGPYLLNIDGKHVKSSTVEIFCEIDKWADLLDIAS